MVKVGYGLGPSRSWGRIHDAAKEDDVELLIDIVEARNGAPTRDIDLASASGLTPLHVAALSGSNGCISYLLARCANVDLLDDRGRLAIHWAAESGHTECVMHLVSAGQSMNLQDQDGNTPLHLAARNGIIGTAQYLIEIGANISLKNKRAWTPHQAATVPMMRVVMDMLEQTLSDLNQIRRDHDSNRIKDFLLNCGMERYLQNIRTAGYTAVHLLDSCKPIHLSKLNEKITTEAEKISHRDYLLFLEALQSFQGSEKSNPFHEAAKRNRRFDENPEALKIYISENPDFDINTSEDSEFRRKVLPEEKAFMSAMLEVLDELRKNDKHNIFHDICNRMRCENPDQGPMFPGIENLVDSGWKNVRILDLQQIEQNIRGGMYRSWEQFQNDCFMMIANVWIFCRAAQSDTELSFRAAVALSIRTMRIFKKHNNYLRRRQAAFHAEYKARRERHRRAWGKIEADKRLRGFLPDLFKEQLLLAEEEGEAELKRAYPGRFSKASLALAHWGYHARNTYEMSRCAWEEDMRAARDHAYMLRMLDLASSRDAGRHFQHPPEDHRSDAHIPGGEVTGPFTVEGYLREIVWPMDFDTMRARLLAETERDHHLLHPETYYWLEQVQLDWLIIVFNVVIFHNRFHLEVKRALDREQHPPYSVPRAPSAVRLENGEPQAFTAMIEWEQPRPKTGEVITAYEIQVHTLPEQDVDPIRTRAAPGETVLFCLEIAGNDFAETDTAYRQPRIDGFGPDQCSQLHITAQGGKFNISGLCPATSYKVLLRSRGMGEIFSPKSGPPLLFTTKPYVPEAPSNFRATSISSDHIIFEWAAPRDNGADTIDYEVEYTDLLFEKTFRGRVGWNATSYSTISVLREPDGCSALSPRLFLPYQDNYLRPATSIRSRVRARNSQGWGSYNEEGFYVIRTLAKNPDPPKGLAVVAEGFEYLDLAWMPPLWSNSHEGITKYCVDLVYEDGGIASEEHYEFDVMQLKLNTATNFLYRPPSRTQRTPKSRGSSTRKSSLIAGRSRPGTGLSSASELAKSILWQPISEENLPNHFEAEGTLGLQGTEDSSAFALKWWQKSEFLGKCWFSSQIPLDVQRKASLDFPVINNVNNVIIFQELGPKGWEEEVRVTIPAGPYNAIQLANRTQSILQNALSLHSPLRWNVFVNDCRFHFVLNRRFRLTMAGTLAYAYGFVLNSEGWIVSPDARNVEAFHSKSVLVAPNMHKLETAISDLVPTFAPFIQRVKARPGHNVKISIRGLNGFKDDASEWTSSSVPSECINWSVLAKLPSPPVNIRAEGVLSSEIVVNWINKPQQARPGEEVIHLDLHFRMPDGKEESKYVSPLHEGYSISGLHPGQSIQEIKIRCVSQLGPGPFSEQISATTKCIVPSAPKDLKFMSATTCSQTFAWLQPDLDGGCDILEWEVSGFFPDGSFLKYNIPGLSCSSYEFHKLPESAVGISLLDVSVRCRNLIGWSKPSNRCWGKCLDNASLFVDTRRNRMDMILATHNKALECLTKAIVSGQESITAAERAAHQPARFKKALVEDAENAVILAENSLIAAIYQSEVAGIKEMGVMQHEADIQAREILQIMQNKRAKRWGASQRGPQV